MYENLGGKNMLRKEKMNLITNNETLNQFYSTEYPMYREELKRQLERQLERDVKYNSEWAMF